MNIDKPCHNSSCEPTATGRRSKKSSRIAQMHTESLTRIFLTFVFDANRFQTDLQALPLAAAEINIVMLAYCNFTYIYCPKESKCRHLQNPSKISLVLPRYNQNQKINQKNESV